MRDSAQPLESQAVSNDAVHASLLELSMIRQQIAVRFGRGIVAALVSIVAGATSARAQSWGQNGVVVYTTPQRFFGGFIGAVNNSGQVAGATSLSPSIFNPNTGASNLPNGPGVFGQEAHAINNLGHVVGRASAGGTAQAALWTGGAPTPLGTLGGVGSWGYGMNDAGIVVGTSSTATPGVAHAFLWSTSGMLDLGTLGGQSSDAFGVNNNGQVVGRANSAGDLTSTAFLWQNGVMQSLGSLGGVGGSSNATAINNAGQVVGTSTTAINGILDGFIWSSGVMQSLGALGSLGTRAYDVSDAGQAIGSYLDINNVFHAALWENTAGGYHGYDLASIVNDGVINNGWQFREAMSISDNGDWITAFGTNTQTGYSGWVVMQANAPPVTATPEPASMSLMATGLAGMAGWARRRRKAVAA
jgi:probable HAF family extracellular repeat protein